MEELKDGVKKVGTEVKAKVKKKANAASEFVKGVQEKEYRISGDTAIGSGLALSGILIAATGKILKLSKENEKQKEELHRSSFQKGVLLGKVKELRYSEALRREDEQKKANYQE